MGARLSDEFGVESIPDEGTLDGKAWWMWARQRVISAIYEVDIAQGNVLKFSEDFVHVKLSMMLFRLRDVELLVDRDQWWAIGGFVAVGGAVSIVEKHLKEIEN